MGSSGWSIDIEALDGSSPARWADVRETTLDFLWGAWRDTLPSTLHDQAWGWVSLGEDSLLTLGDRDKDEDEATDRISFWFYDSVEWPIELVGKGHRPPMHRYALARQGCMLAARCA